MVAVPADVTIVNVAASVPLLAEKKFSGIVQLVFVDEQTGVPAVKSDASGPLTEELVMVNGAPPGLKIWMESVAV
jgi:hypothetical protein